MLKNQFTIQRMNFYEILTTITKNKIMRFTKKQKLALESLHNEIRKVIIENSMITKEQNWDIKCIEIRGTYDAFRILNIIQDKFN